MELLERQIKYEAIQKARKKFFKKTLGKIMSSYKEISIQETLKKDLRLFTMYRRCFQLAGKGSCASAYVTP